MWYRPVINEPGLARKINDLSSRIFRCQVYETVGEMLDVTFVSDVGVECVSVWARLVDPTTYGRNEFIDAKIRYGGAALSNRRSTKGVSFGLDGNHLPAAIIFGRASLFNSIPLSALVVRADSWQSKSYFKKQLTIMIGAINSAMPTAPE
ncbi:MAG: hypothetical protein PVI21_01165 [Candidatus Woesebacteria bacterium]|jgi:hypothetical protein